MRRTASVLGGLVVQSGAFYPGPVSNFPRRVGARRRPRARVVRPAAPGNGSLPAEGEWGIDALQAGIRRSFGDLGDSMSFWGAAGNSSLIAALGGPGPGAALARAAPPLPNPGHSGLGLRPGPGAVDPGTGLPLVPLGTRLLNAMMPRRQRGMPDSYVRMVRLLLRADGASPGGARALEAFQRAVDDFRGDEDVPAAILVRA